MIYIYINIFPSIPTIGPFDVSADTLGIRSRNYATSGEAQIYRTGIFNISLEPNSNLCWSNILYIYILSDDIFNQCQVTEVVVLPGITTIGPPLVTGPEAICHCPSSFLQLLFTKLGKKRKWLLFMYAHWAIGTFPLHTD